MNARSAPHHKGFTLVEAVIATLLLGILATIVIKLNGQLFKNDTQLTTWQSDTQLLQACIDKVVGLRKTKSYDWFANSINCYDLSSRASVTVNASALCPSPDSSNPSTANCKKLDIRVTGINSTVSLLIAEQ